VRPLETLTTIYQWARFHIPEVLNLHQHRCKNLKSRTLLKALCVRIYQLRVLVIDLGTGPTKFKICHCRYSSALESMDLYANPAVIFFCLFSCVGVTMSIVLQHLLGLLSVPGMTDGKNTEHCGARTVGEHRSTRKKKNCPSANV
jgi:hypothetical protein